MQLGLPGLHYDEAREAGVNAMELLTGAPVTAFRDAAIALPGVRLPLMVQDYIGALNVYLALPWLALTGIGVPNLRLLSVLTGLATLVLLERTVAEWMLVSASGQPSTTLTEQIAQRAARPALSRAGLIAVTLLAASPSFVFWSRQGIFVTNLTQPLSLWCIWQGLRWWRSGRQRHLLLSSLAGGLALYAKLLALWVVAPFALLMAGWWLWGQRQQRYRAATMAPALSWPTFGSALLLFVIGLLPLLLFNWQTGGVWARITDNAAQSYYGVDNSAVLANLSVRAGQLWHMLRGDHLWYLGGIYANELAPWLALVAITAGALRRPRVVLPPLMLLACALGMSLFTVSDLFITHDALLQPVLLGVVGVAAEALLAMSATRRATESPETPTWAERLSRSVLPGVAALIVCWLTLDVATTLRYHASLAQSGGLADHSDASYHLAYYLQYNGLGAPVALDWGLDATVRYLSAGAVTPIEIFGYTSPAAPDEEFGARLSQFLGNPDNVYLLRAPGQTVFAGRRSAFAAAAAAADLTPVLETTFSQRDGAPLYEIWRVR